MSRVLFCWFIAIITGLAVVLLLTIMSATFLYNQPSQDLNTQRLQVGESIIKVEIADTPAKKTKGLSGRESLTVDSGMLFVYNTPVKNYFWMKDMKFSLDFIWIAQGKIIQLDQNIASPITLTDKPVRIYPQDYYDMVLEVPAGWVATKQIKVGDKVKLLQ